MDDQTNLTASHCFQKSASTAAPLITCLSLPLPPPPPLPRPPPLPPPHPSPSLSLSLSLLSLSPPGARAAELLLHAVSVCPCCCVGPEAVYSLRLPCSRSDRHRPQQLQPQG